MTTTVDTFRQSTESTEQILQKSALSLEPITDEQIELINGRDMQDRIYHTASILLGDYGKTVDKVGLKFEGEIIGYAIAGISKRDNVHYGEIAIEHISPKLRRNGLGKLLTLLMTQRLLTQNPDILYSEVADETGMVEEQMKELGYEFKGHTKSKGHYPIYEKDLRNPGVKEEYAEEIASRIHEQLDFINPKANRIRNQIQTLEIDNPDKVDIVEVVKERLNYLDSMENEQSILLFGYRGAKIRLDRVKAGFNNGSAVNLEVLDATVENASEILTRLGLIDKVSLRELYSYHRNKYVGVKIESKTLSGREELVAMITALAKASKYMII